MIRLPSLFISIALFFAIGIACSSYLLFPIAGLEMDQGSRYPVKAIFTTVAGLEAGANVQMAGVIVGKVAAISLQSPDMTALVNLEIQNSIPIPDDSIASVKTSGIIGNKYISISPGGSDTNLKPGQVITDTESAIDIEGLISKFAFGNVEK